MIIKAYFKYTPSILQAYFKYTSSILHPVELQKKKYTSSLCYFDKRSTSEPHFVKLNEYFNANLKYTSSIYTLSILNVYFLEVYYKYTLSILPLYFRSILQVYFIKKS